jgi:hypothetical protein
MKLAPIQQPPFDKRILNLKTPGSGGAVRNGTSATDNLGWNSVPANTPIKRGYMKQRFPVAPFGSVMTFTYLYNPSTVGAQYFMQTSDSATAMNFPTSNDAGALNVPTNNTASWTVMFDRTYELWGSYDKNGNCLYPNNAWGNNPQVIGCWADILQLQWFTGMWSSDNGVLVSQSNGALISNAVNKVGSSVPTGVMWAVPCWAYFGTGVGSFYGWITEWDYTITHYNQFMIPMRCVIDISFTMLPNPALNPNSPGNATAGGGHNKHTVYTPTSGGFVGRGA